MNVKSIEKTENSTATVVLEVEKAQFQAALDKAYRKVKNDIYIPGFRKGKAAPEDRGGYVWQPTCFTRMPSI